MPPLDITRISLPTIVGALVLGACSQGPTPGVTPEHTESTVIVGAGPAVNPSGPSTATLHYNTDLNEAESSLDVPMDAAWARVNHAYSTLKIPITDLDAATHVIGARRALVHALAGARLSHWFSCGETAMGTPRADSYNMYVTALTQLVPAPGGGSGTLARTVVTAFATAVDASSNSVQCSSTGALEQRLHQEFTSGS